MSTSDPRDLAEEIARLANQVFAQLPTPGAPAALGDQLRLVPPPHLGPSALDVGGGGLSGGASLPPFPGPAHALPPASAPPPKEADLRNVPALLGESFGVLPVVAAAAAPPPPSQAVPGGASTPYFLELAGPPRAPSGAATPAVPGSPGVPAAPTSFDFAPDLIPGAAPFPSSSPGIFDPHAVKREFPILRERVHGKRLVWLDNAATTQKPQSVIDRISYYYEHENSNVHRAAHALAARATDAYEAAREKVRRFINAPSAQEIVFARGATEAINLVAQSWGRRHVGPGDEIVVTWLEHHANIVPWQQLAAEKGARLRVAPVDDRGQVILEEYERLLGPRTRLVSFTQVSNALGTVLPAREMVAMAHRHGARVLVDGAQAVSHMRVDVQALDCDFYCFSGHKVFAPMGIGALYGKAAVLESMPPWQGGGNMIRDVTFERTSYQPPPLRFEAGTGSIGDAVGLGAAVDWLSGVGIENVSRHEHELLEYATHELGRVPGLHIIGTAPDKAGVISFVIDGTRSEDVGSALDEAGIAVRSGHHCAQPILRRYGLESSVRASLAPYNTREDVDALVEALLGLQVGRPASSLS